MKAAVRIVSAAAVALAALSALPADAASQRHPRRSPFDGLWSVLISTSRGSCGSYRAAVQIVGGRVLPAGGDFNANGSVSANGATAVIVSSALGSASGYGRLRGSQGAGRWNSAGGECAGGWSAVRRG